MLDRSWADADRIHVFLQRAHSQGEDRLQPDGRLLGEYGTSATNVIAETIWLSPEVATDPQPFGGGDGVDGYAPLAIVVGNVINWVHGNHLGVPIVTTDSAGTAVSPAGFTRVGFPGQTRTLADLYYNRYRDYDPSLGRYIQADPIGLDGGDNLYAYAGGNPINRIDPLGLRSATVADVGGFAFEWWLKRQARPARATPWGRAIGVGEAVGATAAVAKFCYDHANGDDPDKDGPCEIQKREDELECNQWHITGGGAGLTRQQGYAACMRTVMVRYGECRSRGMNPGRITTPLFFAYWSSWWP